MNNDSRISYLVSEKPNSPELEELVLKLLYTNTFIDLPSYTKLSVDYVLMRNFHKIVSNKYCCLGLQNLYNISDYSKKRDILEYLKKDFIGLCYGKNQYHFCFEVILRGKNDNRWNNEYLYSYLDGVFQIDDIIELSKSGYPGEKVIYLMINNDFIFFLKRIMNNFERCLASFKHDLLKEFVTTHLYNIVKLFPDKILDVVKSGMYFYDMFYSILEEDRQMFCKCICKHFKSFSLDNNGSVFIYLLFENEENCSYHIEYIESISDCFKQIMYDENGRRIIMSIIKSKRLTSLVVNKIFCLIFDGFKEYFSNEMYHSIIEELIRRLCNLCSFRRNMGKIYNRLLDNITNSENFKSLITNRFGSDLLKKFILFHKDGHSKDFIIEELNKACVKYFMSFWQGGYYAEVINELYRKSHLDYRKLMNSFILKNLHKLVKNDDSFHVFCYIVYYSICNGESIDILIDTLLDVFLDFAKEGKHGLLDRVYKKIDNLHGVFDQMRVEINQRIKGCVKLMFSMKKHNPYIINIIGESILTATATFKENYIGTTDFMGCHFKKPENLSSIINPDHTNDKKRKKIDEDFQVLRNVIEKKQKNEVIVKKCSSSLNEEKKKEEFLTVDNFLEKCSNFMSLSEDKRTYYVNDICTNIAYYCKEKSYHKCLVKLLELTNQNQKKKLIIGLNGYFDKQILSPNIRNGNGELIEILIKELIVDNNDFFNLAKNEYGNDFLSKLWNLANDVQRSLMFKRFIVDISKLSTTENGLSLINFFCKTIDQEEKDIVIERIVSDLDVALRHPDGGNVIKLIFEYGKEIHFGELIQYFEESSLIECLKSKYLKRLFIAGLKYKKIQDFIYQNYYEKIGTICCGGKALFVKLLKSIQDEERRNSLIMKFCDSPSIIITSYGIEVLLLLESSYQENDYFNRIARNILNDIKRFERNEFISDALAVCSRTCKDETLRMIEKTSLDINQMKKANYESYYKRKDNVSSLSTIQEKDNVSKYAKEKTRLSFPTKVKKIESNNDRNNSSKSIDKFDNINKKDENCENLKALSLEEALFKSSRFIQYLSDTEKRKHFDLFFLNVNICEYLCEESIDTVKTFLLFNINDQVQFLFEKIKYEFHNIVLDRKFGVIRMILEGFRKRVDKMQSILKEMFLSVITKNFKVRGSFYQYLIQDDGKNLRLYDSSKCCKSILHELFDHLDEHQKTEIETIYESIKETFKKGDSNVNIHQDLNSQRQNDGNILNNSFQWKRREPIHQDRNRREVIHHNDLDNVPHQYQSYQRKDNSISRQERLREREKNYMMKNYLNDKNFPSDTNLSMRMEKCIMMFDELKSRGITDPKELVKVAKKCGLKVINNDLVIDDDNNNNIINSNNR